MPLGSGVAVAVVEAGSCSFDLTPNLGTSICRGGGPKKAKKKKKKKGGNNVSFKFDLEFSNVLITSHPHLTE